MEKDGISAAHERIDALEKRIAALEAAETTSVPQLPATALNEEGSPVPGGSVLFSGEVEIDGRVFSYQWERPTDFLLDQSWEEAITRLSAIAHPVRGAILRRLLPSPATIAELVAEGVISSTGTGYHHLGALHSAGWTGKSPDGTYSIRPARVIPLLSIIAAAENH
ncbi:hypothetical protein COCCU_05915 [Corynebacterium occultum]|uniref:ArsR family transcriptional regulator n=1 Tax=Corynebacterium occultum TaxID=2675219 RepID=A0A6B8W593_9CORY|nr:helix-turn-helix domain-containing protein [Corynebacterium occultum]QGU07127.1 hypothetical protein COCCU_05915 [Corynebacterium occultum]